jgi:hypothetical protein
MFQNLEKFHFEKCCSKRVGRQSARSRATSHPARHVIPAVPRLHAHAEASENPSVRGLRHRHYTPTANDARGGLRPVPRGLCMCWQANRHAPLAAGSTAHRHHRRAHPLAPVGHKATEQLPRHAPGPIKPSMLLFRTRLSNSATRRRLPLAPPAILLLHSRPLPTSDPRILSSTHSSFHMHGMA